MKKALGFLLSFAISILAANLNGFSQTKVYIPDVNFRTYLNTNFPTYMDGSGDSLLTDSAALETGSFSVSGQGISDISGLEWFFNVQWLYVYNNNLSTLPTLSSFANLKWLHCYDNQLTVLPDLTAASGLRQLYCYNNQLTTLPDLTNMFFLEKIYCQTNQLNMLPDLSTCFSLDRLYCYGNQLTALPGNLSNTILETLWCSDNQLSSLPNLSSVTTLKIISCDQNILTVLPDMSTLTALENLYCYSNLLTQLPDLSNSTALTVLGCTNNLLSSLPDMTSNTALNLLLCDFNKLDFSDARELRIMDTLPALATFIYTPQNPFGDSAKYSLCEGDSLALSISSQDSALSYQWFRGTDTIVGATDTILIMASLALTDSGIYTCRSYGNALLSPPILFAPGISEFVSEPISLTVSAYPTVTFTALSDICMNSAAFALSGGSPAGGTYFGPGVNAGNFDPGVAGSGTHTITYIYGDSTGCTSLASQDIVVKISYLINEPNDSICIGDSALIFGTFRMTAGTYYDSTSTVASCDSVMVRTLVVNSIPTVNLTALSDVCSSTTAFALSGGTPAGGTYSGTGVNAGNFDPAVAGVGTHTITYSYSDAIGCGDFTTEDIVVDTSYLIFDPNDTICAGDGIMIYGIMRMNAGTYFDTLASVQACDSVRATDLIVKPLPTVSMSASSDTICVGDAVTFTASPAGYDNYTFYQNGTMIQASSSNIYSTTGLMAGDTISVMASNLGCSSVLFEHYPILLASGPAATLVSSDANNAICDGDNVVFTATPTGSTTYDFFVNGVSVQSGSAETYSISTLNNADSVTVQISFLACTGPMSNSITTTVTAIPAVTLTSSTSTVCEGDSLTFTATPAGYDTYSFYRNGVLVQSGASNMWTTNILNNGDSVSVTGMSASCPSALSNSIFVSVNPLPAVSFTGLDSVYCIGDVVFEDTLFGSPLGGIFTGTGVVGSTFEPFTAGIGTFTITYSYLDMNECIGTTSQDVTIYDCSSVSENELDRLLGIFPNPTKGEFVLEYSGEALGELSIRITNFLGQEVLVGQWSHTTGTSNQRFDLSEQPAGIYQLHLSSEFGLITRQIAIR